jgi:hypothetical protein
MCFCVSVGRGRLKECVSKAYLFKISRGGEIKFWLGNPWSKSEFARNTEKSDPNRDDRPIGKVGRVWTSEVCKGRPRHG